ncbi:MAG: glucoamylase family protein, partial [Saprospiraceae bacterium]|nr:glucoamylase family protein [Saprospiraceae bacterium]
MKQARTAMYFVTVLCALLIEPIGLAGQADALLDQVQQQTFNYFWEGGEAISGAARERIHLDGIYPHSDQDVVTSGGTGFGIMATIAAIERGFITRKQGWNRLWQLANWLDKADRFHGAWAHWMYPSGRVKPFSRYDDGGDLVETAFLVQGLLVVRQYFRDGNAREKRLANLCDRLWKEVDWNWYTQGRNVLYWHWSPNHGWQMDFAVRGYNECTIMYILAASSPTHPVAPACYHEGYMKSGEVVTDRTSYGHPTVIDHYDTNNEAVGPLFWAHYSFLGLDPRNLRDTYVDYWQVARNHARIHHNYCADNPLGYRGYGPDCWGLTSSYSMTGYASHKPTLDFGVISPTAALSSFPYTPAESMAFLEHLYT